MSSTANGTDGTDGDAGDAGVHGAQNVYISEGRDAATPRVGRVDIAANVGRVKAMGGDVCSVPVSVALEEEDDDDDEDRVWIPQECPRREAQLEHSHR